jgi:hypothetical protein
VEGSCGEDDVDPGYCGEGVVGLAAPFYRQGDVFYARKQELEREERAKELMALVLEILGDEASTAQG